MFGSDHPEMLRTINALALLYNNRRRYDEAEPLLKEALDMQIRVLGDAHPDLTTTMSNLA